MEKAVGIANLEDYFNFGQVNLRSMRLPSGDYFKNLKNA